MTYAPAMFASGSSAPTRFDFASAGTWIMTHGLGRMPMAFVYLANGELVIADEAATATTLTITHAQPQAGFVLLK